jgi:hypothetical protein
MRFFSIQHLGTRTDGKTQCDFSAMLSPDHFNRFVLTSIEQQCNRLDYSLYHLDGKEAIKHLDAILSIKSLNALQWVAGEGQPDSINEKWYYIYNKVRKSGKEVWAEVHDGTAADWIRHIDKFLQRYGPKGVYILTPSVGRKRCRYGLKYSSERMGLYQRMKIVVKIGSIVQT